MLKEIIIASSTVSIAKNVYDMVETKKEVSSMRKNAQKIMERNQKKYDIEMVKIDAYYDARAKKLDVMSNEIHEAMNNGDDKKVLDMLHKMASFVV
ncbi:MAG: hypothetical protein IJ772_05010 [Bacilli bacterium]|nr:hypothetical protein [Bacilli bacterium]